MRKIIQFQVVSTMLYALDEQDDLWHQDLNYPGIKWKQIKGIEEPIHEHCEHSGARLDTSVPLRDFK